MSKSLDELERAAGVLGQVCVMQGESYWVGRPNRIWEPVGQRAAQSLLKEHWSKINHVEIEPRLIEEVIRRTMLPVVTGVLASPVASEWVEYDHRRFLNLGVAPRLAPSELGDDGRLFFDFINRNICTDGRDGGTIRQEVLSSDSILSPTRWVWHWLAHQYQRPGLPLSTALWVISVQQGVGKGLFADIFRDLLGRSNTTVVNAAELKGDWNDWMVGKTLIVADEINVVEKKSFYATIKRWIGNPTVAIRKRNVGQFEIPATQNWLFLTNDPSPITIDRADRRHMFVEAENDLGEADRVIEPLRPILADPQRRRAALAELGAWLDSIPIDETLLRRALQTGLKDEVVEATTPPPERWFREEVEGGRWKLGTSLPTDTIWERYKNWATEQGVFGGQIVSTYFTTQLTVISKRGYIAKHRTKTWRGWTLVKVPEDITPQEPNRVIELRRSQAQFSNYRAVA
jgi:hypothetical protein